MKTFKVFYDVVVSYGVLKEMCLTVHNCRTKHDALRVFDESRPKNSIFRSVKAPLFK